MPEKELFWETSLGRYKREGLHRCLRGRTETSLLIRETVPHCVALRASAAGWVPCPLHRTAPQAEAALPEQTCYGCISSHHVPKETFFHVCFDQISCAHPGAKYVGVGELIERCGDVRLFQSCEDVDRGRLSAHHLSGLSFATFHGSRRPESSLLFA